MVQLPPATILLRVTVEPMQTSEGPVITAGVGFTVIVKFTGMPEQPFADGTTVMVSITSTVEAFIAIKEAISPVPVVGSPIEAEFIQVNTVPVTDPVKLIGLVAEP